MGLEPESFQRRKDFLGLTVQDEQVLQHLHEAFGEGAPGFVDSFYRHLLSFEEMRVLIPDDAALERLKAQQIRYFHSLTAGRYGEAYGNDRRRVGLAHARIGLPPSWYLSAYSHYLTELLPQLPLGQGVEDRAAALQALIKVVFLDIGLAIDSYIELRDTLIAELRDYGSAFAHLPYGTLVVTETLEVVFANQAFACLTGCTLEALQGRRLDTLMDVGCLSHLVRHAQLHQHAEGVARLHPHGQARAIPITATVHALDAAGGQPLRLLLTTEDLRERERLASFDTLTGLPNRLHGLRLARQLLDEAHRSGRQAVVLFADLDRFKEINDTQGHAVGDRVLAAIAQRSQQLLGEGGVLARLGGDEFMFARLLAEGEDAQTPAWQAHGALAGPVAVDELQFGVGASIGAALYPAHGQGVDELLQRAHMAMHRAKTQGGGCLLYDESLGHRLALGTRLEVALQQSLLELHYQPKIDLATGQLCGVEALARWHDAQWGWVSPAEFIPVAEERGLIAALGDWSLDAAARQWRAWREAGMAQPPPIAVNVSAMQMMADAFAERALAIVRAHGVPAQAIELEITESALMHHPDKARHVASQLVEQGFALSIDDFGTGYSSLARLNDLPVSRLKIDMSFVRGMLAQPGNLAIVTAVIGMARALGLRTVAEGVETPEQLAKLRDLQCGEVQGWLFAKAMPAAELERLWLRPA